MYPMKTRCIVRISVLAVLLIALLCGALPAAAQPLTLTCIVPDGQYVNVRKRPAADAATWGVMHAGDAIVADPAAVKNGFFETVFAERTAYVSVRYFEIPVDTHYVVEANGRVRLRKSPAGSADGFVRPGDRVYVCAWRFGADGSKWARCAGGQYIDAGYLRPAQ